MLKRNLSLKNSTPKCVIKYTFYLNILLKVTNSIYRLDHSLGGYIETIQAFNYFQLI